MGTALFVMAGLAAMAVGLWQGAQAWRFAARGVAVTGQVVAAPGQVGDMASAHPTIEFIAVGGQRIRYRQNGMGPRAVGTPVALVYDPAAPAGTATVRGFWTQWFPALAPLALGLAFLLVPLMGVEIGLRGARP